MIREGYVFRIAGDPCQPQHYDSRPVPPPLDEASLFAGIQPPYGPIIVMPHEDPNNPDPTLQRGPEDLTLPKRQQADSSSDFFDENHDDEEYDDDDEEEEEQNCDHRFSYFDDAPNNNREVYDQSNGEQKNVGVPHFGEPIPPFAVPNFSIPNFNTPNLGAANLGLPDFGRPSCCVPNYGFPNHGQQDYQEDDGYPYDDGQFDDDQYDEDQYVDDEGVDDEVEEEHRGEAQGVNQEEQIDVSQDIDGSSRFMVPLIDPVRIKPRLDGRTVLPPMLHFSRCASMFNGGVYCDCPFRYLECENDLNVLYSRLGACLSQELNPMLATNRALAARDYYPSRVPWLPHYSLLSYKYQGLFRVQLDPNGGATSVHLYMDELVGMTNEEIEDVAAEFISLSFLEDPEESAYHVIGVVHGGANYLPDLLDYFADHYGFITVNIGSLSGPESHAHCLSEYRDRAYKTYSNGTFRFSPLQELSICGVKGEEYGAYFPDFVKRLEESPFMGPVMPWSRMSVVSTDNPRDSNDGPIFWIRPGEQTIPLTERSKRRCTSDMPVVRLTEDRQALFEDRTRPHADQIGVDGKGTRDNTAPTAAVGVLKAVNCGHPEHAGRATKDVVAFHAGDYDRMQKIFSLDFYEPPLRQCHAWLDTAQLNSLRRDGLRYARLQLHDGDIYYLPRKIVHQFQTISAVASVAWHVRFRKYFEEHGAPNLNLAKGNKGAIYHEKTDIPPYVPPPPTDDEADTEAEEEPEPEEPPPPRRRRPQRATTRRGVRRKTTRRNVRLQNDDSDDDISSAVLEMETDPSTSENTVKIETEEQADPGPSTSRRRGGRRANNVDSAEPAVPVVTETPSTRRGRKARMPITAEDMPAPGSATVPRSPVAASDESPVKTERPRDLKAIKREATEEFAAAQGQTSGPTEKPQKSESRAHSRTKKSKTESGSSSKVSFASPTKINNENHEPHVNGESSSSSRPSTSGVRKSSSASLESDEILLKEVKQEMIDENLSEEKRSEQKRDKSSHEESSKRREHKSESSHSSHKSRSDKKHGDSRSSRKDSDSHSSRKSSGSHSSRKDSDSRSSHKDSKHSDEKRSRENGAGSSRSSHSSDEKRSRENGAGSSRSSHSSDEKRSLENGAGSSRSSHSSDEKRSGSSHSKTVEKKADSKKEKTEDKKKRSNEGEDDSSHKRRRDSIDSHRSSESKREEKDAPKDEKRSDAKKPDTHRHTNGSSSSHRHKSSTESRHSDKGSSSHRVNGSHLDSGSSSTVATPSQPIPHPDRPDSTTSGDIVSQTAKTPVKSNPDQSSAGPSTVQESPIKEDRKAVKRKHVPRPPPPPSGNVIGEIMAQMDRQRQM